MRSKTSHFRHSLAFTLIELLVVMTIAVMLMSLIAQVFGNFGRATALNTAGNRLVNLIHLARQNSLAKNAMTALVFITDPSIPNHHRTFAILQVLPKRDGSMPDTIDWKQLGKWETLEDGIIVNDDAFQISDTPGIAPPLPPLQCNGKAVASHKYVIFLPDGSAFLPKTTPFVELTEGFFLSGLTKVYTRPGNGNSPANYYKISILNATGRTKIDRP